MLLFGSYAIGQNNYIHDCENKGIAVVINGSGHANLERAEVLAEGNVVERCGSSIFLWTGLLPPDAEIKYENILIRENYFINAASGWRMHNQQWIGNGNGSIESHGNSVTVMNIFSTGEILIENNLFYRSAGPMVEFSGEDFSHKSKVPTMRGNTYVQDESQVLFRMRDEVGSVPEQAVICSDKKQRLVDCVKNGIGDKSGNVIVLR